MKLAVEPVERGANVIQFSEAVVMLALTQPGSAKIKSQCRESETVQRLHGVKHDLIVQRSPVQGMRMANQCGVCSIRCARVQQGFQASRRAFERKRTNGIRIDHL